MAVVFRVGLRQRPPEKNGKEGRVRGQPVPALVPMHEQTAAKPRDSSPQALGFSADTDSLLEGAGFAPSVPRRIKLCCRVMPLGHRRAQRLAKRRRGSAPMYLSRPWRVPPAASHHKSARLEPLSPHASLAKDIAVFEIALGEFEYGRIAGRTDLQPSDIGAAERCCGGSRARSDHIDQLHSEAEKFRHCHQLIERRPLDAECVNVTADDVREKSSG